MSTEESFHAELPDVVAGLKTGRENNRERIICQLVGMDCPDIAVETLAYSRMMEARESVTTVDMMA